MLLKPSLIALALALFAAAGPIPHIPHGPVPRGASLSTTGAHCSVKTADGHFVYEHAVSLVNQTMNKYRQSLLNLQKNKGVEAFDEGVTIMPLRHVHPTTSLSKRQSEALTDQEQDLEWTGIVSVGTPSQSFVTDFDTGSSDFWVPLTDCQTCQGKNLFDPTQSSTNSPLNGTFSISYGDGSTASGVPFQDTVSLAGINVTNQIFAGANQLTGNLVSSPGDGLMGLAFPVISQLGVNNTIFDAFAQGSIPNPQFSFKLAETGSSLFIGGQDTSLFTGSTEFHPLSSQMGFWQIGNCTAKVNGAPAVSGFDTIVDSGTTLIVGPTQDVASFYAQIPGAEEIDPQDGFFAVPCDSNIPAVSFNWGGQDWTVNPNDFNLGPVQQGSSMCALAIVAQDTGLGSAWIVGDVFLKAVYSTFDFGQFAVGFSQLAQSGASGSAPATGSASNNPPSSGSDAPCPCSCAASANPTA